MHMLLVLPFEMLEDPQVNAAVQLQSLRSVRPCWCVLLEMVNPDAGLSAPAVNDLAAGGNPSLNLAIEARPIFPKVIRNSEPYLVLLICFPIEKDCTVGQLNQRPFEWIEGRCFTLKRLQDGFGKLLGILHVADFMNRLTHAGRPSPRGQCLCCGTSQKRVHFAHQLARARRPCR